MKKKVKHLLLKHSYNFASWQCLATCRLDDIAWAHVARMTLLGHMLLGSHCLATCCLDDIAWPHVAWMTLLGHMSSGWHCLVTCPLDDIAWPHVAWMTLLGHMLPGWHYKTSLTWDRKLFHIHHILLISHPPIIIFSRIWSFFTPKNIPKTFKTFKVLLFKHKQPW